MQLLLPLPDTSEFRVRASGPALVVASIHTARHEVVNAPDIVQIIHSTCFPQHSRRYANFTLPVAGEYLLEAIKIYDVYSPYGPHDHTACTSFDLNPCFVGRVRVMPTAADSPAARYQPPLRAWVARSPTQVWTRHQQCSHISLGTYRPRGAAEEPRPLHNLTGSNAGHAQFEWRQWDAKAAQYTQLPRPPCERAPMCMLGDSHGRHICDAIPGCRHITQEHAGPDIAPSSRSCRGHGPFDVHGIARCCSRGLVILHVGQWDLGWPSDNLTRYGPLGATFRRALRPMVQALHAVLGKNLNVMSTHYIPLNCAVTQCPPSDWRTPPLIEQANRVMREIAEAESVPFIDTHDLLAPIWDHAPDWVHESPAVPAPFDALVDLVCSRRDESAGRPRHHHQPPEWVPRHGRAATDPARVMMRDESPVPHLERKSSKHLKLPGKLITA